MALELVDLDEPAYLSRRRRMIEEYAREASATFGTPYATTLAIGEEQIPPFGAPGHLVRTAVLDGAEVAFVWVALPGVVFPAMAWLNLIEVAPHHRGRGLGARVLAAVERDLTACAVHRLGLHVFGHNAAALHLYTAANYTLLNQIRSSRTPAIPPAALSEPAAAVTSSPPAASGVLSSVAVSSLPAALSEPSEVVTSSSPAALGVPPAAAASSSPVEVELRPMGSPAREERVVDVASNDPVALTRDPAATRDRIRQVAAALGATGEFRSIQAGGRRVGWLWFAEPDERQPAYATVRYLYVNPFDRRHGYGRSALAALSAELAVRGILAIALNIPGTHKEVLAFADALGLAVLSQQMVKDLPAT